VTFATVHGNGASIAEAKKRIQGSDLRILAVTLLTSLNRDDVNAIYGIDYPVEETVLRMAKYLVEQGCDGVIASPREAKRLKSEIEGLLIVTPGIRDGDSSNDHQRVGTSRQAISDGAEYIVVGRPIYQAADPRAAARRYLDGIAEGLRDREG
jgi:orotidine-5'-phosphate decarboxylase